ncbi:MAG: hypothetical protein UU64_C0003G0043 [candidate division WWE3 bacterium GW2011_GWF2_41_45]|uniref:Uncharacterized protein n=1 Tax=candidate division WWE3 bacterium GW2011_GWC2_41_23 TaxID=1619123 RepID=A0A0G0VQZ3_UNCKA|nr:MAG: hypothetical protein UU55_C0003G0074 [candidate division WWE3 bacterium GW2011_GWC2_41_23]KKS10534.1 MAG: hypothetical protein UU64_C0003G0043 [candidate division WWE3 bacterium GW2011_GWF2_41_45]KKS20271.1 MAG: hypothetical protein UU79_C0002G0037 [candidate division WWE3 bacterium GW2011_GWE1_41_72]KKS51027.1 MAG: hypothetical protein UV16_C0003G0037 [candidate division WWE3 bacterium GW2011_GWE2_42_25]KKS60937.1 MAG: hypothetical protein UV27_C0008G0022 [candidate division WWE3 bacte
MIMVFLMIVSTTIGITISNRFMSALKGLVRTDDSVKALKAAEAIIERLLIVPNETLEGYIMFGNCGSACAYSITEPNGNIVSATVSLEYSGNSTDPFSLNLEPGEAGQINLLGYASGSPLDICWYGASSAHAAYIYEEAGVTKINSFAVNSVSSPHSENGFDTAAANHGFPNCFTITTSATPKYVRIKPYYEQAVFYAVPAIGQTIPRQGIILDARGYSGESAKHIIVLKTDPMAPAFFDYALLQTTGTSNLTNSYGQ